MSFISLSFAIFFLILIFLYHLIAFLSNKVGKNTILIQNILLLVANLFFYSFADLRFLPFLIYSIAITYLAGLFCRNKKVLLLFLIADLFPLLAIKYCPVILQKHWIFPLGISFFTFQSISYIVDTFTKKIPTEHNPLNVALFISFFPVISSGPIQRGGNLIPQFTHVRKFDYDNSTFGIKVFAWGLFKKICIADRIAVYVNHVYANCADRYGVSLLLATILFSFQIYCDFSGYSDMAIGISRYLGFDVGKNFDHPYLSKSVSEFWKKWHISLSSWLRDYIYIPLGGSRVSTVRIYLNLIITFLVSGVWHGSTLNFVFWGLLHGIFQCIGKATDKIWNKNKIPSFLRIFITFSLITLTWIFFRTNNLIDSFIIIKKILQIPQSISDILAMKTKIGMKETIKIVFALNISTSEVVKITFGTLIIIVSDIFTRKNDFFEIIKTKHPLIRWIFYSILIYLILFLANFNSNTEFLYFAF